MQASAQSKKRVNHRWLSSAMQQPSKSQWWSKYVTHWLHILQWCACGGRHMLHVVQYR